MRGHARFEQGDEKRTMSERIVETERAAGLYKIQGKQIFCKHVQGGTMKGYGEIRVPLLSKYSYEYYLDFKRTVGYY